MSTILLSRVNKSMYDEAKRLLQILYDEKKLFYCNEEKVWKYINADYKYFSTYIELKLIELSILKHEKENYLNWEGNLDNEKRHYIKYKDYKLINEKINLDVVASKISQEIISNYNLYKNCSVFIVIPKLCKKYIKGHHDSVDYMTIYLLLNPKIDKIIL